MAILLTARAMVFGACWAAAWRPAVARTPIPRHCSRMRIGLRLAVALGCAAVLCTCESLTSPSESDEALRDRVFVSEAVLGRTLVSGTEIRLGFRDGELSAYAGCNHLGGRFHIDGNELFMDEFSSTSIGCDAERHAQDQWLQELLTGSPTLDLDEPRLIVSGGGIRLTLIDREVASPDRPLVGTRWIGNGTGDGMAISFGPASASVTVAFGEDGRVEVFTSCQTGAGTFTADATMISFAELAYDGAACPAGGDPGVSSQVMAVLDGSPVSYEIEEANLTIRRADRLLMFRADE